MVVDKLAVPVRLEAAGEDPAEPERIALALEEQGYFRADVPLNYELQDALHTACERYDIDYPVALGLIEVESNFQPDIVNATGDCYGLCQLNMRYFPSGLPPEENINHGRLTGMGVWRRACKPTMTATTLGPGGTPGRSLQRRKSG